MKKVGFIGHGEGKFTIRGKEIAIDLIYKLMKGYGEPITVISGHSPVGGIDMWAEKIAEKLGFPTDIKAPKQLTWGGSYGFRARNIDIGEQSNELHVILVDRYPSFYKGIRFSNCYHCGVSDHVKSGACWTRKWADRVGTKTFTHIIENV